VRAQLLMLMLLGMLPMGLASYRSDAATPPLPAVDRPYSKVQLGVQVRHVSDEEAQGRIPRGVVVIRLADNFPAVSAGIRVNDCILKFDGQDVNVIQDLWTLMMPKNPGGHGPYCRLKRRQRGRRVRSVLSIAATTAPLDAATEVGPH